jgi:hypothetical protein
MKRAEDRDDMYVRNFSCLLSDYRAMYPRRLELIKVLVLSAEICLWYSINDNLVLGMQESFCVSEFCLPAILQNCFALHVIK